MTQNGKRPNVLFVCHVEPMFEEWFPDEMYLKRIRHSVTAKKYDRVILLASEVDDDYPWLVDCVRAKNYHDYWVWGWGYEKDMWYDDEEDEWLIETNGTHEWTWVPQEIRDDAVDLRKANVFVSGGGDDECLHSWCCVLDYMDIPYERIEGLIYG